MAKTVSKKHKHRKKSKDEESEADLSTEKIDKKSKKRRKIESISSSSDSDDNKTPSKVNNTSRKTAPSSDSDGETPQRPQKIATTKSPLKSTNLMDLFKDTNELSEVSTKSHKILADLADSDVYFVQIPKNLHPQLLTDTLISLDEKAKLRVGKSSYVWDSSEQDPITLNVTEFHKNGRGAIKRLNCQRITVREQFKLKQFPVELQQSCEAVPFPLNLKPRHPLFGRDFADKIKLDDRVKQKLASAREQQIKKEKKVKRKKRTSNLQYESYVYEEMFSSQNDFSVVISEENDFNFEVKKKKKKKKELD